jgi:hypothetical protein
MRRRTQVVRSVGVALVLVASVTLVTSTAQARPIGCGSVVTHDVVLTRDLLGCQGDGLVIGASGITVNLGGHTVAGVSPTTVSGSGTPAMWTCWSRTVSSGSSSGVCSSPG